MDATRAADRGLQVTCMMDLRDGLALAEFIGILSGPQ